GAWRHRRRTGVPPVAPDTGGTPVRRQAPPSGAAASRTVGSQAQPGTEQSRLLLALLRLARLRRLAAGLLLLRLLRLLLVLLAEDQLVALGEILRLRQADANDAHGCNFSHVP